MTESRNEIRVEGFGSVSFSTAPQVGKFSHETPYTARLASKLDQPGYLRNRLGVKLRCLSDLRNIIGTYENYTDAMAGVGITSLLFRSKGRTVLNETDPGCRAVLAENFPNCRVTSFDAGKRWASTCDVSLLDFNTFTLKRISETVGDPIRQAVKYTSSWIVINDCSVFYLRYGSRSYEVYGEYFGEQLQPSEGPIGFLRASSRFYASTLPGWGVKAIRYFRESAFVLLKSGWVGIPDIKERGSEDSVLVEVTKRPR